MSRHIWAILGRFWAWCADRRDCATTGHRRPGEQTKDRLAAANEASANPVNLRGAEQIELGV